MENPQNTKRGSSRQTPARFYSFKRVLSLDKEFHSINELKVTGEDHYSSSDSKVTEGKEVNKHGSRKRRNSTSYKTPDNILLYGNGDTSILPETHAITKWTEANKNGRNIVYHSSVGLVEVMRDGLYFIYSQMCFSGNRNQDMAGHRTFINFEEKMTTTPARLIYFCVFLSIVVCLSFVLSVYSFKRVLSLDKEFHSRTELKAKEEEQVASSDRNVAEGKEVDKYGSRKHRSQLPGERQSLIPESILLYGNGKRYALQKTDVVTQWTKANKNGNKIAYRSSVGRVEVMRDGLYFIYSQIVYVCLDFSKC
ncbi:hypothetical protein pdam_00001260 [Pocillopora damicornis]|uniref:THD domain-containing protein n=1 Tax=Pocillopora damicornis TaxID=46731 RepID=A0A3M6TKS8_POCDA|nr:hypothetical protein pdam_00001260 [Pocillopora damicornis]